MRRRLLFLTALGIMLFVLAIAGHSLPLALVKPTPQPAIASTSEGTASLSLEDRRPASLVIEPVNGNE